ncbi:MAG: PH domain-containing protein [Acidimicrobiales bacterium]|jgi:putative membrane protein
MPAAFEPPDGTGDETFRLHPLTPLALGGRILGVLVVFALFSLAGRQAGQGSGPNVTALGIYAALAVLVVIRGLITVAVTRYHLHGGELRIDSGLLRKQSKRVRLNRVQSVDVLEPFSARIFGLAEVKVTTAGTERSAVRLRYLSLPVAKKLRADLLGRSGGGDEGAPEAPERPVVAVPHGQLVGSVLLEMVSWRLIFLFIGPILTVVGQRNGHKATSGIGIALFVWFAFLIVTAVWRRVSTLWDFTVTESPDGLRIRHGLLSTSRQTVPPGRIQAILVHQPVGWRLFGWAQVRMNVAGYAGSGNSKSTMLLPVADRDYALALVGWLLGGVDLTGIPLERPPRRASIRAPLWWRAQLVGSDDHVFTARHGLLSRTIDVVPHERTQSVRLTSGPLQRALALATVHLDSTRGPVKIRASNRDSTEARAMLDRQVERARRARLHQWVPSPPPQ